jgi:hypothetical protein
MNSGTAPIALTVNARSEADLRTLAEAEGAVTEDVRWAVPVLVVSEEVPFRRTALR